MTKTLQWRLKNLPSTEELRDLVKDKLITVDEARKILFSENTEEDRDKKSLESEIKFLRELVDKLSKSNSTIVETIRYVEHPYIKYPWYGQYNTWCSGIGNQATYLAQSNLNSASTAQQNTTFTGINTF